MAKVTLPGGIEIGDLTPEQAAEVAHKFLKSAAEPTPISKPKLQLREKLIIPSRVSDAERRGNGFDTAAVTLELLEAIKAASWHGLPADKVQSIVHANSGKGIGGRMVRINGYLRDLGFLHSEELFDNPKNRKTGRRVWKPKAKLDDAIEAARKGVKG